MPRWEVSEMLPLSAIRAKAGFSRERASVKLAIGSTTLSRYEANGDIPLLIAEKMAELYSVEFDAIREAVKETQARLEKRKRAGKGTAKRKRGKKDTSETEAANEASIDTETA